MSGSLKLPTESGRAVLQTPLARSSQGFSREAGHLPNSRSVPHLSWQLEFASWDFAPGKNLPFTPRGDVPVTFGQLWNVSNSFDLCRIAIEMRKNQIVNRPWLIRVKEQPGEKKERTPRERSQNSQRRQDSAVAQIPRRLSPIRQVDSGCGSSSCLFSMRRASIRSEICWAMCFNSRVISGATDHSAHRSAGFVPQPPSSQAFQQIILGIHTSNLRAGGGQQDTLKLTTDELSYSPMNPRVDSRWGSGRSRQIITTLSIASNRQTFLRDFYREGNVPEGLLNMPEGWTGQQIKDFQNWFDSMLAGNLGKRRRMIMVPGGGKSGNSAQFSKTEALTDNTDEYLIRVVFGCFGLSPSAYVRQVGHQSTNKEGNDMAQETGLEPILAHIEVEMNRIIEGPS